MSTNKDTKCKEARGQTEEKRSVGRPRKEKRPLRNLTIYLTDEEREKIESKREKMGLNSTSSMMRMILRREGII